MSLAQISAGLGGLETGSGGVFRWVNAPGEVCDDETWDNMLTANLACNCGTEWVPCQPMFVSALCAHTSENSTRLL